VKVMWNENKKWDPLVFWWNENEVGIGWDSLISILLSILFLLPTNATKGNKYSCIVSNAPFGNEVMKVVCDQATKLHKRSPIFLSSYDDVEEIKALNAAEAKEEWSWKTCILE